MQTAVSADGTDIAYDADGRGQPLVLIHGGSSTRDAWRDLAPRLVDEFEVVTYDRRGRGASGDADDYALEREVEDLRAVTEAVDGDPLVFGHSFGGLVALAAAGDVAMDGLALYEPALLVGEHRGDDLASRMESLVEDGDRIGAVELFFEEVGASGTVPEEGVRLAADLVETVVRENYAVEAYELGHPHLPADTLLLTGEQAPEHLRDGVFELESRVDGVTVTELAGVGHLGIHTCPEVLADELRAAFA